MGDDNNDFPFPVNQNLNVPNDVPDIGAVTLEEDSGTSSSNTDVSPSKIDKEIGSFSFTVVDMSSAAKPKNQLLKEPIQDDDEVLTTRKSIVFSKVPFEKGYNQMDWLKLTQTHPDLAGLKGASNKGSFPWMKLRNIEHKVQFGQF